MQKSKESKEQLEEEEEDQCAADPEVEAEEEEDVYIIKLKTLTGKTISFDVKASDTVMMLKYQIEEKEGIPPNEQRLIFNNKQLKSGKTMSDYNIIEKSVLHLTLGGSSDEEQQVEWETLYGFVVISGVKHLQTYGGGPGGGLCPQAQDVALMESRVVPGGFIRQARWQEGHLPPR